MRNQVARAALIETLEARQLMSVSLGTNIITNPGGESNTGSSNGSTVVTPSGWTDTNNATVIKYNAPGGFPLTTDPGPTSRGKNFFAGGPKGTESDLSQTIDVSSQGAAIDAAHIKFALQGYLGGFSSQSDNASVFLNFQSSSKTLLSQAVIGPVTAANRANKTGLLLRTLNGVIPKNTRFIQLQIHFDVPSGFNDGYADELSLVLTSTVVSTTGGVSGTVFNDANGNAIKDSTDAGLGSVKVFVDKNNNGLLDAGEPNTTTAANGTYTIAGLAAGSYKLREIVPSTYRATTTNPLSVTVTGGSTATGKNFGDSQTAVLSGVVFGDTNGNKTEDSTEKGIQNVVVYLDFNNNGQLDSFELKTTTDASGKYNFIVPFGTYVVREVVGTGKTQTTPSGANTITVSKGQVVTGKNFGIK